MKILFFINHDKPNARACTEQAVHILTMCGAECYVSQENRTVFQNTEFRFVTNQMAHKYDLYIAVGGDGTILETAQYAIQNDKPLLGINAGSLGFMAGLEPSELYRLQALMTKNYQENHRLLLDVTYGQPNQTKTYTAINDIILTKQELNGILDVEITEKQRRVISYRADSIIFSTPTGSTAYALSNGGPIADANIPFLAMAPVSPHSLFSRTFLFSPETELQAHLIPKEKTSSATLLADGKTLSEVDSTSLLCVTCSKRQLRLVMLHERPFYEVIANKFSVDL